MTITTESVRVHRRLPIEGVACRAFLNANQSNIASASNVKVALNAVTYDLGGNFTIDTYKFTVPVSGLYHIVGRIWFLSTGVQADKIYKAMIFKNSVAVSQSSHQASVADYVSASVEDELYLEEDDYVELYTYTSGTGDTVDIYGEASGLSTFLVVRLITKEGIRQ